MHHIRRSVFVWTQGTLGTGYLTKVIALGFRIALVTVGQGIEMSKHPLARNILVLDGVVSIVIRESSSVEYGQREIHGQGTAGRDISVHVAIGIAQRGALGLLKAELDEELEELMAGLESSCDSSACGERESQEQDKCDSPAPSPTLHRGNNNWAPGDTRSIWVGRKDISWLRELNFSR